MSTSYYKIIKPYRVEQDDKNYLIYNNDCPDLYPSIFCDPFFLSLLADKSTGIAPVLVGWGGTEGVWVKENEQLDENTNLVSSYGELTTIAELRKLIGQGAISGS